MAREVMKFFDWSHLDNRRLADVSKLVEALARDMEERLPECEQKRVGLQKLLEARDCFVRSESCR